MRDNDVENAREKLAIGHFARQYRHLLAGGNEPGESDVGAEMAWMMLSCLL